MARAMASICFCPPERLLAAKFQKRLRAGKRPRIQSSRSYRQDRRAGGSTMFSRTVRSVKMPMASGT